MRTQGISMLTFVRDSPLGTQRNFCVHSRPRPPALAGPYSASIKFPGFLDGRSFSCHPPPTTYKISYAQTLNSRPRLKTKPSSSRGLQCPLASGGQEITSDKRIRASTRTFNNALDHGAAVILASHLGRPKGKPNPEMSLKPVAKRLAELLAKPVAMAPDCVGPEVER